MDNPATPTPSCPDQASRPATIRVAGGASQLTLRSAGRTTTDCD